MNSVHGGEDVNERTAGPAEEVKSANGKLPPGKQLTGQEQEAQEGGQAEPRDRTFIAERDAGDGPNRRKSGLAGDGSPRQVDGDAAEK